MQIDLSMITYDEARCGSLILDVTTVTSDIQTAHATLDQPNLLISMDDQPQTPYYIRETEITLSAWHSAYPSVIDSSYIFTLIEIDCSVRFEDTPEMNIVVMPMNTELSRTLSFDTNSNLPELCMRNSRTYVKMSGPT